MTQIVGVSGFKRSGKGEVGQCLTDAWEQDGIVYCIGFADKLKIMAARALGYDERVAAPRDCIELMDDAKENWDFDVTAEGFKVHGFSGRQYLQNFGNHARNLFGDTFWIDQVLPRPVEHVSGMDPIDHAAANQFELLKFYGPDVDVVAITDVRYPNEAERIRALGGVVWQVQRPGAKSDGHASEQPLPEELVDRVIVNDGSLDDLRAAVTTAMQEDLL